MNIKKIFAILIFISLGVFQVHVGTEGLARGMLYDFLMKINGLSPSMLSNLLKYGTPFLMFAYGGLLLIAGGFMILNKAWAVTLAKINIGIWVLFGFMASFGVWSIEKDAVGKFDLVLLLILLFPGLIMIWLLRNKKEVND